MRILFVSADFPANLQTDVQGPYKRMRVFIDAIKDLAQLDVLFYVPPEIEVSPAVTAELQRSLSEYWNTPVNLFLCPKFVESQPSSKLLRQGAGIFNFFKQANLVNPIATSGPQQVQAFEACLDRQPDAVFVHRLRAMSPALLTRRALPPLFFDLDDIEHIAFLRGIRQPPTRLITLLYALQIPAICWGERQAIQLAQRTFVCSELDRDVLTHRWQLPGVVAVPNAVPIPAPQPITPEPTLMLLGAYHYFPNINAANFLIEQVWPRVHQVRPDAKLIIAGKEPQNIRSYAAGIPGVEFTGFVEDLDALYQRSRIVCCPIFSGGGTRIKMIEAAAYGKPIVATRIGAEGLAMQDGQDFLLRNSAEEFAQACLDLLQNDTLCHQLGAAARAAAIRHYDRAHIVQRVQDQIRAGLGLSDVVVNTPLMVRP